jgi:hypothetical protein
MMIGSLEVVPFEVLCERSMGNAAVEPGMGGAGEYQCLESKRRKFKSRLLLIWPLVYRVMRLEGAPKSIADDIIFIRASPSSKKKELSLAWRSLMDSKEEAEVSPERSVLTKPG